MTNISLCNDRYFTYGDRHKFFNALERVAQGINKDWTYESGKLAHIDVVSCVTSVGWGNVPESASLLANCRTHFVNTLGLLPSNCYLLCDGRTALDAVRPKSIEGRDRVGNIHLFAGKVPVGDRKFAFAGWNFPTHKFFSTKPEEVGRIARKLLIDQKLIPAP